MNSRDLLELKNEGIKIREFPPKVLEKFRDETKILLEAEAGRSPLADKIYRSFKRFKEENADSEWRRILEKSVDHIDTTTRNFIDGLADSREAKVVPKRNRKVVITFNGFTSWSSQLPTPLVSGVYKIVKIINDNSIPVKRITLEGHASTIGSDSENLAISRKRAAEVAQLLINKGIDKNLVVIIPHGEKFPLIPNEKTEEELRINRRVEIVIEY